MEKHMNADSGDVETNPVVNTDKQLPKDTMEHVTIGVDDVRDDDNIDAEVRACLEGFPSYTSNKSSSPSSCSFYSSCTLPGRKSEVDTMSSYSYYSTGTVRDTDTDTASYCSVDTMVGDTDGEEEREEVDVTRSGVNEDYFVQQVVLGNTVDSGEGLSDITRDETPNYREEISTNCDPPYDTHAPQSYPTGSCLSENPGSASSSVSEGEVSFAGQVNDRLGRLLGYDGEEAQNVDVEAAIAKIMGYEIVGTEKDRFTVKFRACDFHKAADHLISGLQNMCFPSFFSIWNLVHPEEVFRFSQAKDNSHQGTSVNGIPASLPSKALGWIQSRANLSWEKIGRASVFSC